MVPAFSTWLHQNSPKFFMYILARVASTTVVKLPGDELGVTQVLHGADDVAELADARWAR